METELTNDNLASKSGKVYKDRGDWSIAGQYRPDQQGFIGSTNNPGPTGTGGRTGSNFSKFGGPTHKKGDIVEMDGRELQQFMDAGGQIEFV